MSLIKMLPLAAGLVAAQSANLGDVDSNPPYGMPAREFSAAVARPNATMSYPIQGFGAGPNNTPTLMASPVPQPGSSGGLGRRQDWAGGNDQGGAGNEWDNSGEAGAEGTQGQEGAGGNEWQEGGGNDGSSEGQDANNDWNNQDNNGQDSNGDGSTGQWDEQQNDDSDPSSDDSNTQDQQNPSAGAGNDWSNNNDDNDDDQSTSQGGSGEWALRIHVTADVSLDEASTDDSPNNDDEIEEGDVTQLTVMSLTSSGSSSGGGDDQEMPEGACGFVFRGLGDEATREANDGDNDDDGSCEELLSEECRNDLEEAARESGEDCEAFGVPESCDEWMGRGVSAWSGSLSDVSSQTGRFYAHASPPEARDSDEARNAYAVAATNVWPVLFSWEAGSNMGTGSGSNAERNATLRCVRAGNVAQGSETIDDVPNRDFQDEQDEDAEAGADADEREEEQSGARAAVTMPIGLAGMVGFAAVLAGLLVV